MIKILYSPWKNEFEKEIRNSSDEICIIVPFISKDGVDVLLNSKREETQIRLITRINDEDIFNKVISVEGLIHLQKNDVSIRVHNRRLHSKLYLFDERSAIVTSSNLTGSGLNVNSEIGITISYSNLTELRELKNYFNVMWDNIGQDIDSVKLNEINNKAILLDSIRKENPVFENSYIDYGLNVKTKSNVHNNSDIKFWCKFINTYYYGINDGMNINSVSNKLGAFSFHTSRKPNHLNSDDLIFHVSDANTMKGSERRVFGRAKIAHSNRENIDELPKNLKSLHPYLDTEPYCIWLYEIELIDGVLSDGIPLNILIKEFGDETFVYSQEKLENGEPNKATTALRCYYSHIELTQVAAMFLNEKLEKRFKEIGKIMLTGSDTIWWNDYISKKEPGSVFIKVPF